MFKRNERLFKVGRKMPRSKRFKTKLKKYLLGVLAAILILSTLLMIFPMGGTPKSRIWLVGLSTSGLKTIDSYSLKIVSVSFLFQIPATYKYSFAVDGDHLYIGLTYGGAQVYRVNLKKGTVDTLTVSGTGDLRDLKVTERSLYALVMDYSSETSLLVEISLDTFTVRQRFHLEAFVKGIPYKLQLVANAAYVVAYDSNSSVSSIAYISLPTMNNYFAVQVPVSAATKLDTDGNKIYVRGNDEVAIYTCTPPLDYVGKVNSIFGYGDILCLNGKIYVAGSTLDWKPAVYILKSSPISVEQTILLSTNSGAALNLASKDSTVYAFAFSSGVGCFLSDVAEKPTEQFTIPNTKNEFPTCFFFLEGELALGR
jgi:hypothetical protein